MSSLDTLTIFDIETSGLDSHKHEIVQFAACAYSIKLNTVIDTFEAKLDFDRTTADPVALNINGYDPDVWAATQIKFPAFIKEFDRWSKPHRCVRKFSERTKGEYYVMQGAGYNVLKFDYPWMCEHYARTKAFLPIDMKVLDIMQLAMWRLRLTGTVLDNDKQGTVCRHFGIEYNAHDALADVQACATLIGKLVGR